MPINDIAISRRLEARGMERAAADAVAAEVALSSGSAATKSELALLEAKIARLEGEVATKAADTGVDIAYTASRVDSIFAILAGMLAGALFVLIISKF